MTVSAIRDALKAQLQTIDGLQAYDTWPGLIVTPAVLVKPDRGTYHEAMGSPGHESVDFELVLLVQLGELGQAQDDLDAYVDKAGLRSIKAAVETDKTLGGTVDAVIVRGWRDYGVLDVNEGLYVGAVFEVTTWPTL